VLTYIPLSTQKIYDMISYGLVFQDILVVLLEFHDLYQGFMNPKRMLDNSVNDLSIEGSKKLARVHEAFALNIKL
jgi:hypothetical protein